jgi:hypothetical protein
VATVGEIYRSFVDEGKVENEIASLLNARGIVTDLAGCGNSGRWWCIW